METTSIYMGFNVIGTLALTGFPFLSGFYSKDAIIEFAYLKHSFVGNLATCVGIFTAFLTAIYSWRLMFMTFHGKFMNKKFTTKDIHESPMIMILPLVILSFGAIFSGYFFKDILIGNESKNFWLNSIFFRNIFT